MSKTDNEYYNIWFENLPFDVKRNIYNICEKLEKELEEEAKDE